MPVNKKNLLTDISRDNRGNVAMMFGLCTLTIVTLVGAAVDYSGMTSAKQKLQNQVDSGVLAAARVQPEAGRSTVPNNVRKKTVRDVMEQNGFDKTSGSTKISIADPTITVRAKAEYQTAFMGLIGKSKVTITAEAQSQINAGGMVQIALVLDNTGSMGVNGKLPALKTGAKGLLTALSVFPADKVAIGIVPFAKNVNVGSTMRGESWLDLPDEYTITRSVTRTTYSGGTPGTCTTAPATGMRDGASYTYDETTCTGGTMGTPTTTTADEDYIAEWTGCVGARPANLHIEDGTYSTRIPGITGFEAQERSSHGFDRWNYCPKAITALTNDFTKLDTEIDALFATDSTYMPLGIAWGTRILSPGEPFAEAKTGADVRNIMILMTDGVNTVHLDNPPYLDDNNTTTAAGLVDRTNQDTKKACRAARKAGIEVITIAFQVTDPATKTLLESCATGKRNYFDAGDNSKLIDTFKKIGARLNEVRLTQ